MKNIYFTIVLVYVVRLCWSQQFPLYTQQVFDPYLLNPSMVAAGGRAEVNLTYRNQWAGLQDGPKTIQADFQYPFSNRMAFGISLHNDRTVLLSNTSAMATFGYKVYFTKEQYLAFGLSGGIIANRIRLEDIGNAELTDPALLNSANNNTAINSQFGVHYSFRNLSLGFAMLQLFDNTQFSEERFQKVSFDEMENIVFSLNYRFALSDMIHVQPNFTYRINADALNGLETSAVFSYDNKLYVGGGYRQSFGPIVMARVRVGDLQIGYSYDFPATYAQVSVGGTNEIQLKWTFGDEVDKGQYNIYKNYNRWYKSYKRERKGYRKKAW